MNPAFLFSIFMKIDQVVQSVVNALVLDYLNLHDTWVVPALLALSLGITLVAVGFAIYFAIRWLGWRSLVVFVLEPRIWVILLLYTKSRRLFWPNEARIPDQSPLPFDWST